MSSDNPRQRRHYPAEFKSQLINQALNEHVALAALSRQHGINVNLIFRWTRKWQTRGIVSRLSQREDAPALVPVIIFSETSAADTALSRLELPPLKRTRLIYNQQRTSVFPR